MTCEVVRRQWMASCSSNAIVATGLMVLGAATAAGSQVDQDANVAAAATPANTEATATPTDGGQLSEIVVTATRRTESELNVPVSVSAYTETSLDDEGIKNFADLARVVPGIQFYPAWAGSTSVSIRGISSSIGAGTTGIYIDDTPIQVRFVGQGSTSTNAFPDVFDLERVEILRGPQGTLFGSGSEGGTVRFIMPEPSLDTYTGYARAETAFTDGGDPSYEVGAAFGGPIVSNSLGFRVSAYTRDDGGWVDRASYPSDTITEKDSNSVKTVVLRAAFTFAPIDNLQITPDVFYQDIHRDDLGSYWENSSDPARGVFLNDQPLAQPGSDHFVLPSLKVQAELAGATLISNTSYMDRRNPSIADYSNYIPELLGANFYVPSVSNFTSPVWFDNTQQVLTQEVRLQSTQADGRWTWVVGGFYQRARQGASEIIYSPLLGELTNALYGLNVTEALGVPLGPGGLSYTGLDSTTQRQLAGFGQVDFKPIPNVTLTAGLRVSSIHFSYENMEFGPLNGGTSGSSGTESDTPVTPKFGASYKPNESWMVYTSVAKGFRPGGVNTEIPAARCAQDLAALGLTQAPTTYNADSVWSYEVGAKGQALGGDLQLASSVFYIPWEDTQQPVVLPLCGFTYIANLGSALSKGSDLQVDWRALRGLTFSEALSYTHAKYTKTVYGGVLPSGGRALIVADGDPLMVAPWQLSTSVQYEFAPFQDDKSVYVRVIDDYQSGYYSAPNSLSVSYDPNVTTQDSERWASVRIGMTNRNWDASIFANNVLNSHSNLLVTHDTVASTLFRIDTYRPFTAGITAIYRY